MKEAKGRWQETGEMPALLVEESEIHGMEAPLTLKAVRRGDGYDFGDGAVLSPPPPDDTSQRHEFELEQQRFERTRNIAPSELVK